MINTDDLSKSVKQFFLENASAFDLEPASLSVDYIFNPGGFVNYSFRIGDARPRYHLKLATSDYSREGLLRWQRLSPQLEGYHAPRILSWIEVGAASGLLCPWLDGPPPSLSEEVLQRVLSVMRAVHADTLLREALADDQARTARETYAETYHDRFTEDLRYIRDNRPPFISADLIEWLQREVHVLSELVGSSDAFSEPARTPVHNDLWLNNILWQSAEEWHIIDWDGIRLGDPMTDLAMLTGPSTNDLAPLKMFDQVAAGLSESERARLLILGRASLLDWIIDPVADWIDAEIAPALVHTTRREKERVHRAALAKYAAKYRHL